MKKGFTLIELLVVIAIIGILSSVVLVSVGSARKKAKDASIKAEMTQVRSEAEMLGTYYDGVCHASDNTLADTGNIGNLETSITTTHGGTSLACYDKKNAYCVKVTLPGGDIWCVDSTGYSGAPTEAITDPKTPAGCSSDTEITCQ